MKKSIIDKKADLLMAIAHPNRIRILEQLRTEIKCNCELAPALGLEQSNLSRQDGLRVNFKIADERIFEILDLVESSALRNVPVLESEEV
jgi:predicted transcriptional regulator